MDLILLRHAIAVKGTPDSQRQLSKKGRERFHEYAKLIAKLINSRPVIFSSPYVRTWQTAQILASHWPHLKIKKLESLKPGQHPRSLLSFLQKNSAKKCVVLVGHEPDLSLLAGFLLFRQNRSLCELKKGGIIIIEINSGQRGTLKCCLQPAQYKKLLKR